MQSKSQKGTCMEFCPAFERKLRIDEKMLHFYEYKDGQKNVPGIIIKSFSRSAAGHKVPNANELRTKDCLQKTIEYLLTVTISDKRRSYSFVYEFIFDRLRAIRQEIIIQKYTDEETISILEPIIMFLSYSRYNLCTEPIEIFNAKICDTHLQECLKRVLCCYDEIYLKVNKIMTGKELKCRIYMESLYQVFNMGASEAIFRGLTLPAEVRKNDTFNLAFSISKNYYLGDVYFVLNKLKSLPHILCGLASIKLPIIRRKLLLQFSHAYNNVRSAVENEYLCRLCLYDDNSDLIADCQFYGLNNKSDNLIVFLKNKFLSDKLAKSRKEKFVTEKFKNISLANMLLLKQF